jgi:hypothetical protein
MAKGHMYFWRRPRDEERKREIGMKLKKVIVTVIAFSLAGCTPNGLTEAIQNEEDRAGGIIHEGGGADATISGEQYYSTGFNSFGNDVPKGTRLYLVRFTFKNPGKSHYAWRDVCFYQDPFGAWKCLYQWYSGNIEAKK